MTKKVGVITLILLILIFGFLSYRWIKHRMEYAISDAVFVKAENMSNVAFEVSGKVVEIYKDMGDFVRKGEALAKLESIDYQLALKGLEKDSESLRSQIKALEIQKEKLSQQIDYRIQIAENSIRELREREKALKSQRDELKIQLEQVERDRERLKNLLNEGLIPKQKYEEVDTKYKSLLAKLQGIEASIREINLALLRLEKEYMIAKAERLSIEELEGKIKALKDQLKAIESKIEKADLDLKRTILYSPFDGLVAKRFVNVGDFVMAGQPAFSLIEKDSFYVEVLLEETKLKGIREGSKAYIRLDAYPRVVFEGIVKEISPASAATFALVPRDVSAGEFTKVVQRIPIKIKITKGDMSLLRVGMGGRVEIKRE